ncbi:S41 family peptidase [Halorhodospira neutriphila]|uniref:Peptidase S41 n=1 Tax=Halorhodospira neutriphila TaxID=168379 RepID=A0ABS1E626_9GAMM|nr:S41 family peptidase [Halorhodospira neutriphila]MBK1726205.1 peptidase S41 [Halorhodospira neutriphila]
MRRPIGSLLSAVLALGLALAPAAGAAEPQAAEAPGPRPESAAEQLPLAELELLAEVYGRIKRDYVEAVDDRELFRAAIRGMLSELDAHSGYLDSEAYEKLQEGTRGEFGGVGLELSREAGLIQVVAPIDDTPASRAGLRSGDAIIRIDGQSVRGIELSEAVQRLRGEPGNKVEITVVREAAEQPLTFELERAVIQVDSVRSRMLEPGYGYVRISQFQQGTGEELRRALESLLAEAGGSLHGLVLDLRNNPGGVLQAAVAVADAFLAEGQIVSTKGRVEEAQMAFDADSADLSGGAPLAVLINRGSASASEIVAGALQDHGRAVIMGETSFGKGSVQSIIPLDEAAMKLTTARYFTPSGRSIQAQGITPDIAVEDLRLAETEPSLEVTEADLEGHLPGQAEADGPGGGPEGEEAAGEAEASLARRDYVLFEALSLLKGMRVLGAR